ncbi:MAG TPA: hypothetical protein VGM14_12715 [Streptosporangiaceae bacterium]
MGGFGDVAALAAGGDAVACFEAFGHGGDGGAGVAGGLGAAGVAGAAPALPVRRRARNADVSR